MDMFHYVPLCSIVNHTVWESYIFKKPHHMMSNSLSAGLGATGPCLPLVIHLVQSRFCAVGVASNHRVMGVTLPTSR